MQAIQKVAGHDLVEGSDEAEILKESCRCLQKGGLRIAA